MDVTDKSWRVLDDKQWGVEQCRGCPLPGYLLVWPTTKARTLSEIPPDLVGKLGRLLQRVVGALESVLAPERIYILQFGEETQDVHFHVFPRTTKLTLEYLQDRPQNRTQIHGPLLFEWARDRYLGCAASEDTVRILDALRKHFSEGGQTSGVEGSREQTPRNRHT